MKTIKQRKIDQMYMDIAVRVSSESKAKRLQVGAILVKDGQIVIGYNGMRSGASNNCETLIFETVELPTYPKISISTYGDVYYDGYILPVLTGLHQYYVMANGVKLDISKLVGLAFFNNVCSLGTEMNYYDGHEDNFRLDNIAIKCTTTGKLLWNTDYFKTKPEVIHAESNLASKLMKSPIDSTGSTVYVTHSPCIDCAKILYQAGVDRVVYLNKYKTQVGVEYLKDCEIEVVYFGV